MDLIHICKNWSYIYVVVLFKECNETIKKKELVVFNEMPFNIVK